MNQIQIDQLNDSLADKNRNRFKWSRFIAVASIIGLIVFSKSHASPRAIYTTEQTPIKKQDPAGIDTLFKTIKGKIVISDHFDWSPEVYIHVRGTNINGKTDKKGRFKLRVPVYADTLEVMEGVGIGQYVKISSNDSVYHVNFENGFVRMGGIKVKPGQKFNKALLKRSVREVGQLNEPFK